MSGRCNPIVSRKAKKYHPWRQGYQGVQAQKSPILLPADGHRSCRPYLLTGEALSSLKEDYALIVFERLFKERGLPAHVRSDNGVSFASAHSSCNLISLPCGATPTLFRHPLPPSARC